MAQQRKREVMVTAWCRAYSTAVIQHKKKKPRLQLKGTVGEPRCVVQQMYKCCGRNMVCERLQQQAVVLMLIAKRPGRSAERAPCEGHEETAPFTSHAHSISLTRSDGSTVVGMKAVPGTFKCIPVVYAWFRSAKEQAKQEP